MKIKIFFVILLLTSFMSQSGLGQAHTRLDGNRQIETRNIDIADVRHFMINMPGTVTIENGATPSLTLTTDANIFSRIQFKTAPGILQVKPEGWVEPSTFILKISLPNLEEITTSGYGNYRLNNVQGEQLTINNGVGHLTVSGQVNRLVINAKKGMIDAAHLDATEVWAKLMSSATVLVKAPQKLEAILHGNGKVVYEKRPIELITKVEKGGQVIGRAAFDQLPEPASVSYVNLKLHNNRLSFTNIRIEGPVNRPFGYGTRFFPFFKRKERFPVGTKIYEQFRDGKEALLVEITAEDDQQTVPLF